MSSCPSISASKLKQLLKLCGMSKAMRAFIDDHVNNTVHFLIGSSGGCHGATGGLELTSRNVCLRHERRQHRRIGAAEQLRLLPKAWRTRKHPGFPPVFSRPLPATNEPRKSENSGLLGMRADW